MNRQNGNLRTDKRRQKITIFCILLFSFLLMIMLAGIVPLFLWKIRAPKQAIAQPTKVVLHSLLSDRGWYPADTNELNRQIEGLFQKVNVEPIYNVIALILPHAGYAYSGRVAASGIKSIDKKYQRIIVIGPSHYVSMEEVLSVPRVTHYETPLGEIPLDVEFINKLLKYSIFQNVPQVHQYEHSVLIELPLLQHRQMDFKLVPIVAGQCSLETITKAGSILRSLIDQQTLVIASSDFTHYGPNYGYVPFTENVPEQIKKLDMGAYEYIEKRDCKGFLEYIHKTGDTICGYVPISILLSMLDKDVKAELIQYNTSGQLTNDFNNSVSYLSIVFTRTWAQENKAVLTKEDKKHLLTLARKTIIYALQNQRVPEAYELDVTISDAMTRSRAAFVTLKKDSQLRGCIGEIFPQRPLYKSVIIKAINAGLNDSRFPQVTEAECKDIKIEISALTPPQPIDSPNKIRIGIDGVVLNKDGHSAVFLPQVAPEQGWDLNQMLGQLSLKAGLPPDAWKEGASFLVFQAEVFGEE